MRSWKARVFAGVRSFQSRLLLLATVTSAVAALLVCATLVTLHQLGIRAMVIEQLESQGEVIAFNAVGTLAFDRPDEATQMLASLRAVDHVAAAYLFDAEGALFAGRELRTGRALPAVSPLPPGLHSEAGWLVRHAPVMLDGQELGSVALVYDPSWIRQRMWLNIAAALLITALATLAASFLARRLQQALAVPVREVIGTSRRVSETGDYAIRARRYDDDELGELTDAFNTMLARIDEQAREVRRARGQFEVAVEASPQGMAIVDADGRIVLVNRMMEQLFGYSRAEMLGQDIEMLVPAQLRGTHHQYRRQFQLAPSTRAMGADRALNAVRKDGSEFPVEIGLNPIQTVQGLRVLISVVNIEERKRSEAERDKLLRSERAARNEAERASRMKDEFVATLSHELRTPLAAILGWTYVLRKQAGDNEALLNGLETIERNARAQTQLIEDLLDMSRIVSGKIRLDVQLVDLADVIDAAIETIGPAAQSKSIRLQKIVDSRVAPIHGDFGRLQQIVWNLLSNAVKFTPKDGRVQVTLQRINSHIEINVSDTGEGIEPEFLPYLFERFRQADASSSRTHSGLGIGLALVKHLTELHGGTVHASSAGRGKGATITVTLPLAISPQHVADLEPARTHPTAELERPAIELSDLREVRVMVVEDEPDARLFIIRLLEDAQATVWATASPAAALREVEHFRPDVIVSDIGLPQMDGYAFMREIRRRSAAVGGRIPAVALTAFARVEDRARALRAGYQMHIAKPVEPGELLAAIASLASLKAPQEPSA